MSKVLTLIVQGVIKLTIKPRHRNKWEEIKTEDNIKELYTNVNNFNILITNTILSPKYLLNQY